MSFTAVPPALAFVAAAALASVDRRLGHAVGAVVAAGVVGWLLAVPAGAHVPARLFGFEAVLFAVDPVSRVVGLVFAFVAVANVAFAYGTGLSARQLAIGLAYMGAGLGAVFAGDWLSLVVWWEAMAVTATALVWLSPGAARSGYRYAVYHQLGGATLVAAVLLHFARTGTFAMGDGLAAGVPTLLGVLGVGLNIGFVGVHVWIVDTYPRQHVASTVILSGFTTKVGVYALLRVVPEQRLAVAYLGGAMVVVGVTMAVLQTDVRRLLSYHIVSQVGYMVAGVGLATAGGRAGGLAHLVNNVLYKTLLFMVAGAVVVETGRESLKKVGGLGRRLPSVAAAFAAAALAITGVPGFSGYVSKGFVTSAVDSAGADPLWWLLQIGAVGTVISFAKFGYYAFLRPAPSEDDGRRGHSDGVGPSASAAFALLAVPCVVFGLFPGALAAILPAGVSTSTVFSTRKMVEAVVIVAAGTGAFALLRRPISHLSPAPDIDRVYHPLGAAVLAAVPGAVSRAGAAGSNAAARAVRRANGVVSDPGLAERAGVSRADIGTGVLWLSLATALALAALLWAS
ncbi:proton-conducting transporter transmembrane domain-containing protein [Halosimplex amylolyticum]|uniref:proton-conducting transporter transmembrane domain-containing protein n=1 Tax=Halosimplex amylolyticum TaxID=3396616 RepID=UPI003F57424A